MAITRCHYRGSLNEQVWTGLWCSNDHQMSLALDRAKELPGQMSKGVRGSSVSWLVITWDPPALWTECQTQLKALPPRYFTACYTFVFVTWDYRYTFICNLKCNLNLKEVNKVLLLFWKSKNISLRTCARFEFCRRWLIAQLFGCLMIIASSPSSASLLDNTSHTLLIISALNSISNIIKPSAKLWIKWQLMLMLLIKEQRTFFIKIQNLQFPKLHSC